MGLFNNIFGGSDSENNNKKINWIFLENTKQLDDIDLASEDKIVIIFKHSTRCSISRFVLKQFENEYEISEEEVKPYFLDLIQYREISNLIAEKYEVKHESPQLLVIKDKQCIKHFSHQDIEVNKIQ